jgi:hypothetical protein
MMASGLTLTYSTQINALAGRANEARAAMLSPSFLNLPLIAVPTHRTEPQRLAGSARENVLNRSPHRQQAFRFAHEMVRGRPIIAAAVRASVCAHLPVAHFLQPAAELLG